MNRFGAPFIRLKHFTPYFVLTMLNRTVVMVFLVYIVATAGATGDLLFLPILALLAGSGIILTRVTSSDKFSACLDRIRA